MTSARRTSLATLALFWATGFTNAIAAPPRFSQVQERRPELIWSSNISKKLRSSVKAYRQHQKLPNGIVYGSVIRDLHLGNACMPQIEKWAKDHGCVRKDDVIKDPKTNDARLTPSGQPVPLVSFLCEDGGVVRVKPIGDPTSSKYKEPSAVKAMRYFGSSRYENFGDEAFKVDDAGLPTPKWSKDLNTDLPELSGPGAEGNRLRYIEEWAKAAHTSLEHCKTGT